MSAGKREFHVTPDWRAQVPFWLVLPQVAVLVALPLWLMWEAWLEFGIASVRMQIILALWVAAGARHVTLYARRIVKYQRRLRDGDVVADSEGLCILPPYGEWRTFPWSEVTELRIVTLGGLMWDGEMRVEAGGVTCAIPPYVDNPHELRRLIRFRANLSEERDGWWTTVYRRPSDAT